MLSPVLMINEAGATHRPDTPPPRPRGQHTYENRRESEREREREREMMGEKKNVSGIQIVAVKRGNTAKEN